MPLTELEGQKIWDDEGNVHVTRPEAITVQLYADGVLVEGVEPTWEKNGDVWTYHFRRLPAVNDSGETITYTVRELPVEGYETTYEGTTIRNHLIPRPPQEYTDIEGTKTWNDGDNADGTRPSHIIVRLLRDGVEIDRRTVTAATGWTYRFSHLPLDDGYGNHYTYSITEDPVPGYFTQLQGYNFVNTKLPDRTPDKPDIPPEEKPPERHTMTPPPPFTGESEEELEELLELPMYGTPLAGMLGTGDETPLYPYLFAGAGALAVIAVFLLGRKRKRNDG